MKKLFIIIIGIFICLNAPATTKKTASKQFKTQPLSALTKDYIQTYHKTVKNKKMVLYEPSFLSASCPYVQAFATAFNKQRQRNDLTSYSFQQQTLSIGPFPTTEEYNKEAEKLRSFAKECGPVCIVNLQKNWIYPIEPGVEEAKTLSKTLTFFKNK